jgi:uncharacterized protein YndB with AHSA1/START domain
LRAGPGNAAEPAVDREFVITRIFDAPARLLFEAYSDPAQLTQWFGPKGWPLTLCEVDFRVGGRYRFGMTGPGGVQGQPFGGTYREIVPNRKIVYDSAFESPDAETMIVTVTFEERAGKTTLTIHTLFGSVAMKQQHLGMGYEAGFGSALDQLGDLVARRLQSERP